MIPNCNCVKFKGKIVKGPVFPDKVKVASCYIEEMYRKPSAGHGASGYDPPTLEWVHHFGEVKLNFCPECGIAYKGEEGLERDIITSGFTGKTIPSYRRDLE